MQIFFKYVWPFRRHQDQKEKTIENISETDCPEWIGTLFLLNILQFWDTFKDSLKLKNNDTFYKK